MSEPAETACILVVDDDPTVRFLTCEALEGAGFRVLEADRGSEALRIFLRERPDIVLLDVLMPEMDGFETCERLRASPDAAHVPILMLTGLDDIESIDRAYSVGATDFATKPLNHTILVQRVRYMLRAGRALEDLQAAMALQRAAQVEAHRLAHYDDLTGLPNRRLTVERLRDALARPADGRGRVAVFSLDLDAFKRINDSLGHAAGDELLTEVAARLCALTECRTLEPRCQVSPSIGRFGGDEFVVVLPESPGREKLEEFAQKLIDGVSRPYRIASAEVFVGASVGIAVEPASGAAADELLRAADLAMCRAKRAARNSHAFYSSDFAVGALQRLALETDLRHAVRRAQLELHFQPLIDAATGKARGAEALLRWRHHDRGMISPADFIPIAEESGLIVPIGQWVIREACEKMKLFRTAGRTHARVAVNVSPAQFRDPDLVRVIRESLDETGNSPKNLTIEITEGALLDESIDVASVLSSITGMGVRVALDDFGTGYSSLAHLRKLDIGILKIDRSFVRDAPVARDAASIVHAIIALGHSMQLEVVGEGVETEAHEQFLREAGCDELQGFLYARPMPATDYLEWWWRREHPKSSLTALLRASAPAGSTP
ncbi:MAG: EAL domain-containing protein [Polyangiaceae bacterium]